MANERWFYRLHVILNDAVHGMWVFNINFQFHHFNIEFDKQPHYWNTLIYSFAVAKEGGPVWDTKSSTFDCFGMYQD
jgi:hypothetical protein